MEWLSQRGASWSSAIINFDAINWHQFFCATCIQHEKLAPKSGIEFMAPVSGASFWSMCTRLYGRGEGDSLGKFKVRPTIERVVYIERVCARSAQVKV